MSNLVFGKDAGLAVLFAGPALLVMIVVIALPFLYSIWLGFTQSHPGGAVVFVGLHNYITNWQDQFFRTSIANSVVFTVYSESFKFTLGLIAALLLHNLRRGRSILTAIILLPWVIPTIATALLWRSFVDPLFGGLDTLLQVTGIGPLLYHLHFLDAWPATWLGSSTLAMPVVVIVNIWKGIPFFTLNFLAGLKSIPKDEYEAAAVDGSGAWQRFVHVTLPGLKFVLIVTPLLSTIWTFNTFDLIWLMTMGGPSNSTMPFVVYAYIKAISDLEYGPGAAVALMMLPITAALVFALARYLRRSGIDVKPRPWDPIVHRIRWWLLGVAVLIVLLMLILFNPGLLWKFAVAMGIILFFAVGYGRFLHDRVARATGLVWRRRDVLGRIPMWIGLAAFTVFSLGPICWMIDTAFKTDLQEQIRTSLFWPAPWVISQFTELLTQNPFPIWFRNTMIVAVTSTILGILLSAFAAYAMARFRFRGSGAIAGGLLLTYIMPSALLFIPLYQIFSFLHIVNNLLSLIIAYPTFTIPFAAWLLMSYYRTLPKDLEESAFVDGANRFQAFWRIVLPLSTPAILAVSLFTFTNAWNEFLYAYVFITNSQLMTMPVGLQSMIVGDILPWGQLMAASLLVSIPVVLLYGYAQRFLVEGLTLGATKG
ncbi:MAG: ABC transporter permease subunit [Candidatus Dormibacteraceae bacterium]